MKHIFWRLFSSEWKKMGQQWLLIILLIILATSFGVMMGGLGGKMKQDPDSQWLIYYAITAQFYGGMLYPILAGVFAGLLCRFEHLGGGWKQLFALPISPTHLYLVKWIIISGLLALSQFVLLIELAVGAKLFGFAGPIPWDILIKGLFSGWVAVLPLATFQLWISAIWQNFALPLTINGVFAVPAIIVAQSATYGPFYPWAQPFLAMVATSDVEWINFSLNTLVYVIVGGLIISWIGGLWTFNRREFN